MENYNLKFENGRNCTIECDSTSSFQDKINEAEKRFNSECCEINGKPIKKHSVGGFIVGATIGAILGNSVPANTISKTASGVKKTAKAVTKKVQKQVKKFSGGGILDDYQEEMFQEWLEDGNVIEREKGIYSTQDAQYTNRIKGMDGLRRYVLKEFYGDSTSYETGGKTDDERYCRLADDTGKGINEGYVVGDGEMYFETEDGLYKHLKELDYETAEGTSTKKIKGRDDLLEYFYADEYYYYTEWDCEQEIEDQGYYYTADGKEIEIASKGKKLKDGEVPRWWNKQVREYMYFVFNTETNKVWAGNEYESDAKDELKEFLLDAPKLPLKVLSKRAITNKKINPLAYENWARGTEVIGTIQKTFESPEEMARGSKVKSQTNNQRVKALVKDLENTPYSIGLAILRERILTYSENDLKSLEKNPDAWENPIISLGMYKDYYERVSKELTFDSGKDNVKAVKSLVKDLENTPYSIGLAILRERLLAYAQNDLKAMEKNPDAWSNPFISLGMYQDYANRVIENLKFEFETGGMSSMALAGASPHLAIASEVSKIAPATTSALDRRIASQIDPDRPKWYEDRGMKYAVGGKVGDNITFKHWSGDVKKGEIIEDLGDGNFDVSSGYGRVLVNTDDIISSGKKSPEKKFLGIFKEGGSTQEFPYIFIGTTMMNGTYQPVFKKGGNYYLKYYNPVRFEFLTDNQGIKNYRIGKFF
jgi:hypothetical protein